MKKLNISAIVATILGPVLFIVFFSYLNHSFSYSNIKLIAEIQNFLITDGYGQVLIMFALPLVGIIINFVALFKKSTSKLTSIGLIIINIFYIVIASMIVASINSA